MGKVTGFMEYRAQRPARSGRSPSVSRTSRSSSFRSSAGRAEAAGRALHGLRHPFCHTGCPLGNLIPDWNDLVYRGVWRRGARVPPLDQQLPRVHRAHLPGAVRSVVRAQHQQRPGDHQADRARDHRPRASQKAGSCRSRAQRSTGKKRRRRRLRARRARLRAAARARRARGHGVREGRPHRRPAALRHPRLQDGEAPHRPPHRADGSARASLPHQRRTSASTCRCARATRRASTRSCSRGGARKPRDLPIPGRELDGRPLRDGFPDAAEPARRRRHGARRSASSRRGKHVIVIGGGDTGSDCIGTSNRQGARQRHATSSSCRGRRTSAQPAHAVAAVAAHAAHVVARTKKAASRDFASSTERFVGRRQRPA